MPGMPLHRRAMEYFHHANNLSFHNQGHAIIRDKVFLLEKTFMKPVMQLTRQVGHLYHSPFHYNPSRVTFTQANTPRMEDIPPESVAGCIFKHVHHRVKDQNGGGIRFQERNRTCCQYVQAETDIKRGSDSLIYFPQAR